MDDVLKSIGVKPYMIQYQDPRAWSERYDTWENRYELQFDTLEEARAALDKLLPSKGRYRIAEAYITVQYREAPRRKGPFCSY